MATSWIDGPQVRLLFTGAFAGAVVATLMMRHKSSAANESGNQTNEEAMVTPKKKQAVVTPRKKVLVSGCYDLLHSGHVQFFKEASELGDLYVSVGSDKNISQLKGRPTMIPEAERLFMVKSIKYVHYAEVSPQLGMIDFEDAIDRLKPDMFFVNGDGDRPAKRALMKKKGVQYVVAERKPSEGLDARSSTAIKSAVAQKKIARTPATSTGAKPTLYYFNGRGRANPARFVMAAAKVEFEEVTMDSREKFLSLRDDTDKLAFGCVPLLEIDGLSLVQTNAIVRYIAAKHGLGADASKPLEGVVLDMAEGGISDCRLALLRAPFSEVALVEEGRSWPDAQSENRTQTRTALQRWLKRLDFFWSNQGKKPFLLGNRMSYADVLLFEVLHWAIEYLGADVIQPFRSLEGVYKNVAELPQMQAYLRSSEFKPLPTGAEACRYYKEVQVSLGRPVANVSPPSE